ncbi:MAG: cyclic nucleotide-binding domain-containing protein [Gammaproteobacteria bacterium]|nr:cyclic nucleotide-binding domain-containing protein [Gammaproteobacteria bacterium]
MVTVRASVELLRKIPLFSSLSDSELQRVIDSPANGIVDFKPLQKIIEENEAGDCMYIVLEGAMDVRIKAVGGREITIATLKAGEFFGEQALLPGTSGRRNATVRALQSSRLFKISKTDAALGMAAADDFSALTDSDDASSVDRVRMMIRSVRLFRSLSGRDLERVGDWTEVILFEAGEIILREAEAGDYMYVVLDGSVEVFIMDDDGKIVVLSELTRGHYFGEQALLPDSTGKRNANVRANEKATLVRVAKRYFQLIVTHDNKLMLALKAVGDAQKRKIVNAIGQSTEW